MNSGKEILVQIGCNVVTVTGLKTTYKRGMHNLISGSKGQIRFLWICK